MGTVIKNIDIYAPLTDEQKKELEKADKMPISFDDDCPELTDEQLSQFTRMSKPFSIDELRELKEISEQRQQDRVKQTIAIRLSPQAIAKAKSLGKGYTSVLSRILEAALADNDTIKHYL